MLSLLLSTSSTHNEYDSYIPALIFRIYHKIYATKLVSLFSSDTAQPDMNIPDSKVHGSNMGPTWVLSDPDGPHVGPMNLAIRD